MPNEDNNIISEQYSLELVEQYPFLFINKDYDYSVCLKHNNGIVHRSWDINVRAFMTDNEDATPFVNFLSRNEGNLNDKGEFRFKFQLTHLTKLAADANNMKKIFFFITASQLGEVLLVYRSLPFVCVKYQLVVKCLQTTDSFLLFYKDRGGKESGIELSISLENEQGNMVLNKVVDLQASLLYESTAKVDDQSLLVTTSSQSNQLTRDDFQLKNGYKQLKFRINQVSSKHCNQKFIIHIAATMTSDGHLLKEFYEIAPANSIPIEVRSKKNKRPLKADYETAIPTVVGDGYQSGEENEVSRVQWPSSLLTPATLPSIPSHLANLSIDSLQDPATSQIGSTARKPYAIGPPQKHPRLQNETSLKLLTEAAVFGCNNNNIAEKTNISSDNLFVKDLVSELWCSIAELQTFLQKNKAFTDEIYSALQDKIRWRVIGTNANQLPMYDLKNPNDLIDAFIGGKDQVLKNQKSIELLTLRLQQLYSKSVNRLFQSNKQNTNACVDDQFEDNVLKVTENSNCSLLQNHSLAPLAGNATSSQFIPSNTCAESLSSVQKEFIDTTATQIDVNILKNNYSSSDSRNEKQNECNNDVNCSSKLQILTDVVTQQLPYSAINDQSNFYESATESKSFSKSILGDEDVQVVFTEFVSFQDDAIGFPAFSFHRKKGCCLLGFYNVLPNDEQPINLNYELVSLIQSKGQTKSCEVTRSYYLELMKQDEYLTGEPVKVFAVIDCEEDSSALCNRLFVWRLMLHNPRNLLPKVEIAPKKYYLTFTSKYRDQLNDFLCEYLPDDYDSNPRCLSKVNGLGTTNTTDKIDMDIHNNLVTFRGNVLEALHQEDLMPFVGCHIRFDKKENKLIKDTVQRI